MAPVEPDPTSLPHVPRKTATVPAYTAENERFRVVHNYRHPAPPPSRVPANRLGKRTRKRLAQQEAEDAEVQRWEEKDEEELDLLIAEVPAKFHQVCIQNLNAGADI